jgi:HK97 family phage prohead protease
MSEQVWRVNPLASLEIRTHQRDGKESIAVEGYAAVYYDGTPRTEFEMLPGVRERIARGTFSRALAGEDDVVALFNHDANHVLGRLGSETLVLRDDDVGLKYEIQMPNSEVGRTVLESIRRRDVTGSSFSFRVLDEGVDVNGDEMVRTVKSVELFDVGPVVFPAYKATTAEANSRDFAAIARRIAAIRTRQEVDRRLASL